MINVLHRLKPDQNAESIVRIGIIAEMGYGAGELFYERLIQKLPENLKENLEIFMINSQFTDQLDSIPDRSNFLLNGSPENPALQMLRRVYELEKRSVDFIVMPCNTAHYFLPEMERSLPYYYYDEKTDKYLGLLTYKSTTPFLHIQKETLAFIQREYPNIKNVGLLGTTATINGGLGNPPIFNSIFTPAGINVLIPPDETQNSVMEGIYSVKRADKMNGASKQLELVKAEALMQVGVEALLMQGAEAVIGGCTEVPIVIGKHNLPVPFIDTVDILANSTISKADELLRSRQDIFGTTGNPQVPSTHQIAIKLYPGGNWDNGKAVSDQQEARRLRF